MWTDEEMSALQAAYAGKPNLNALSAAFSRDKTSICRKARSLGLTSRRRKRKADEPAGPTMAVVGEVYNTTVVAMHPCGEPVEVGRFVVGNQSYPEHRPCTLGADHGGGCEA